jgi:hypothetical protein
LRSGIEKIAMVGKVGDPPIFLDFVVAWTGHRETPYSN